MKYKNAAVGQRVLFTTHTPTYSNRFSAMGAYLGEITEVGVRGSYYVQTGGWSGVSERRESDRLIRVRILGYRGEGMGDDVGSEFTVRPECILDPVEKPGAVDVWIEHWLLRNQEGDRDRRELQARRERNHRLALRAGALGVEVTKPKGDGVMLSLTPEALEKLLELAEAFVLGPKVDA